MGSRGSSRGIEQQSQRGADLESRFLTPENIMPYVAEAMQAAGHVVIVIGGKRGALSLTA